MEELVLAIMLGLISPEEAKLLLEAALAATILEGKPCDDDTCPMWQDGHCNPEKAFVED